jgi:hypothetical protein
MIALVIADNCLLSQLEAVAGVALAVL